MLTALHAEVMDDALAHAVLDWCGVLVLVTVFWSGLLFLDAIKLRHGFWWGFTL